MALWLNIWVFVSSVFPTSNLFSWYPSALKALTTLIPVRFSRVSSFILSIIFWTFLNLGSTNATRRETQDIRTKTAIPVSALHCQFLFKILITAQTAVIGDLIKSCNPIDISIWTFVMSFVVLVIKLLVENFLISCIPKFSTFSNNFFLTWSVNDAESREVR